MPPSRWLRPHAPLLLAALALISAGPARPPVELVESVPVESSLGNPALRPAREVWVEMIDGARRTLDLEEFYFTTWPGEPLEDVIRAIGRAARRGVRVRLLLDAGMSRTHPQPADSMGKLKGITVRRIDMKAHGGGVQHAKYFLVDGREVYLGSQNLDWRSLKHIHELGVRVADARVASVFAETFAMDWAAAGNEPLPAAKHAPGSLPLPFVLIQAPRDTVRLWPSYSPRGFLPDSTLWDLNALVHVIDGAQQDLVAQMLTYGNGSRGNVDRTLDDALRRAAARGVNVRMIVSDWEKGRPEIPALQSLDSLPQIEIKLSTVPEWSGGYIPFARVEHCKFAVADGARLWIGTSNWEPGYFFGSRNLAVTISNRRLAGQASVTFETSWSSPTAEPIRHDTGYEPKVRGEKPPPGAKVYGG